MARHNPFGFGKFEFEDAPVLFIPDRYKDFLAGGNFYVQGSRGTGKTALLRCLCWQDRTGSSALAVRREDFLAEKRIGLYTRIPDFELPTLEHLADDEDARELLFGGYLSFVHCQLLCHALSGLTARRYLDVSADDEVAATSNVLTGLSHLGPLWNDTPRLSTTFLSLARAMWEGQMQIRSVAARRTPAAQIPEHLLRPGRLLKQQFTELLFDKLPQLEEWHVLLCLDEAETLLDWQQHVLNGLVRTSSKPWFYVIAALEDSYDFANTNIPAMPLGDADRSVYSLDDIRGADYVGFAEGVFITRCSHAGYGSEDLSLEAILGRYSVNQLLERQLKESTQPEAAELLEEAAKRRRFLGVEEEEAPPLYETWLMMLDSSIRISPDVSPRERRRIASAKLRKRYLSAYHAICASLGMRPIYAGAATVIALSDQSVRDLLRILFHMAAATELLDRLESTSAGTLDPRSQNTAIRAASSHKLASVEDEAATLSSEVTFFLTNLGNLLRVRQSSARSALDPDRARGPAPI